MAKFYLSFTTDLVIQEGAVRHSGRQDANSVRPDEPGGDGGRLPSPVLCHKSLLPWGNNLMLPAVLLNIYCLLFCWTYAACCSAELMLPAVLLNLYCLLFCWTYTACCSAKLILPAVLRNLCCLLFCWTYTACCSVELILPAVLLNLCCLLFC